MASRWHTKADALYAAWLSVLHGYPSLQALELGLAVAQHETGCGDWWPGEHNWGAVQKRVLSPAERALLTEAGITFPKRDTSLLMEASNILHTAAAAGRIDPIRSEALHFDSSPVTGLYVVWFHVFPDDVEGAKQFVRELAVRRPACRAILQSALPAAGALADAMYASKYFEGFSDPSTPEGRKQNVNEYASALRKQLAVIQPALRDWVAPKLELPSEMTQSITTVAGQRKALNYLGYGRPPLPPGDATDTRFTAVVGFFQGANTDLDGVDLVVDGSCGAKTQSALLRALVDFESMKPEK